MTRVKLTKAEALLESQYRAGVTAGWNAAHSDEPTAALQALLRYDGHLAAFKRRAPSLTGEPSSPNTSASGVVG